MVDYYLNVLYREYRLGILSKRQFEGFLFKSLFGSYKSLKLYNWNQDEYADYINWLYPRLSRAVDRYKDIGVSFSAYIGKLIRESAKEYCSRQAEHNIAERAAWAAYAWESQSMWMRSSEPAYLDDNLQAEPADKESMPDNARVTNPRQLLILILKSYYFVSDSFLDKIAPRLGMEKKELHDLIDNLRKERVERDEKIRVSQERLQTQFYRCLAYEWQLDSLKEGSARFLEIKDRLELARKRLASMKDRLAGIKLEASNRDVSKVLNIPKGTVDSNLYAFKSRRQEDLKKISKN